MIEIFIWIQQLNVDIMFDILLDNTLCYLLFII